MKPTLLAVALCLACCSGSREGRIAQAEDIARTGHLREHLNYADDFAILSFERPGRGRILVVYIEGDGHAWVNPWQPAADPTPLDPVALRLAAQDPARPLLYLARPCQFVTAPNCHYQLWTSHRLSPAVVKAFHQLIDDHRRRFHCDEVGLVGYSGGGALATLIAEGRRDVAWLITVAANLDLGQWTRLHDLAPLSGSLDPVASADAIQELPQVHFAGENDRVVPPAVIEGFLSTLPKTAPARLVILPGFDHECCWATVWPKLIDLAELPR